MEAIPKKRRERSSRDSGTAQALRAVAPAISHCNAMLARCRAVVSLSKPGSSTTILGECQVLRSAVADLQKQFLQIVATLPPDQLSNSRVRDTRLALDKLEAGIEGILKMVAASSDSFTAPMAKQYSSSLLSKGGKTDVRQGGAAA